MRKYAAEIKKFGKKVRKIRLERKMSQTALADYCDVDIRTIQRIEKGDFGSALHIIFGIAYALDTDVSDLFDGI